MQNTFRFRAIPVGLGIAILGFGSGAVFSRPAINNISVQEPDNTATNKQGGATADQQAETQADRDLARKIRSAIHSDKSLSMDAHNVKVIVRAGVVTLKGPVSSDDEKKSIGAKAAELAGVDNVHNELSVKS